MNKLFFVFTITTTCCFGQQQKKITGCGLSKNIGHIENIDNTTLKRILSRDVSECNIVLVDSVTSRLISSSNEMSYETLQKIWDCSDGELSEYMVDKMGLIYHKNFLPLFEYLYMRHEKMIENSLERLLVESWSSEASLSNNRDKSVANIRQNAIEIVNGTKMEKEKKSAYLLNLLKKINPKYLD